MSLLPLTWSSPSPPAPGGFYIFTIITNCTHQIITLILAPTSIPSERSLTYNFTTFAHVASHAGMTRCRPVSRECEMSSLPMISSLSIPLRQPGPKVLSLPDGPACQLHLLPLALPRRPAPFLPPVRREPAPALLPFLPGAWPPGARARARTPPLPSRSTANGSQAPSLPPKRGSLLLRGLHARGCRLRVTAPAQLGT